MYTKQFWFILLFIFVTFFVKAQVGINNVDPNAALDITSTTSGVLIPRVALVSIDNHAPVTDAEGNAPENSTLVYNTATTNGVTGVEPGFYFWNTDHWALVTTIDTPRSELILNDGSFMSTPVSVYNDGTTAGAGDEQIAEVTFTLEKDALVQVAYTLSFGVLLDQLGTTPVSDGAPRMYGAYFTVNSTSSSAVRYGFQTGPFTNRSYTGNINIGYYYFSPTAFVNLTAGTHTLRFRGVAFGGSFETNVTYGGSGSDRLQITANY